MTTEREVPIAVFCSGSGTNLQSLIDQSLSPGKIACVVANKASSGALARAKKASISTHVVPHKEYAKKEDFERALLEVCALHRIELVVLAGFMRVLSPFFVGGFSGKIVNIHPSLLPSFPGLHAQKQALSAGVRIAGCTVHLVDEGVDTGPILAQAAVPVMTDDTEESLSRRILRQEHRLLPSVIRYIVAERKFLDAAGDAALFSPQTLGS